VVGSGKFVLCRARILVGAVGVEVSVGICVHNEEKNISKLMERILHDGTVREVIVVASGCTDKTVEILRSFEHDPRVNIEVEPERRGKTVAFNCILARYTSGILVSLPGDVLPEEHAISRLVAAFRDGVGIVGGLPIPVNDRSSIMGRVAHLAWEYHNRVLTRLSRLGTLGHVSGEIFAVRRGIISKLPTDIILDDAGMAAAVRRAGYRIKVEPAARVRMVGARTPVDFINQRRRNLVGHAQLRSLRPGQAGPPSLQFSQGLDNSVATLIAVLRADPQLVLAVPLALVLETGARVMAWLDCHLGRTHVVWKMATSTKQIQ